MAKLNQQDFIECLSALTTTPADSEKIYSWVRKLGEVMNLKPRQRQSLVKALQALRANIMGPEDLECLIEKALQRINVWGGAT